MCIAITLPGDLIDKIVHGEKTIEMRKCFPKHFDKNRDGVFVIMKGTTKIFMTLKIDCVDVWHDVTLVDLLFRDQIGVPSAYIQRYAQGAKAIYLWHIGHVFPFSIPLDMTKAFNIKRAPQCYQYISEETFLQNQHYILGRHSAEQ